MTFNRNGARRVLSMVAAAAATVVTVSGLAASPASASHENGKATFFEYPNEGWGYLDVDPGVGLNLTERSPCWWWCGSFNDKVSSVTTRGSAAMLFEHVDFEGRIVCVQPHSTRNMAEAAFDNQASSVFVRSGTWSGARKCPTQYGGRDVTILG